MATLLWDFFKVGYQYNCYQVLKRWTQVQRKEKEAKCPGFRVTLRKICYYTVPDQF